MSDTESSTDLLPSTEMSNTALSPAPTLPPRAMGRSQAFVLLILGIGFLVIFSYQFEIHTVPVGKGRKHAYSNLRTAASGSIEPLVKQPILNLRLNSVAMRTQRFRSLEDKQEVDFGSEMLESHGDAVQSGLESQPTTSSEEAPPQPKQKDWKDIKVEAFQPLVESVESNTVSSKFQFVIKVLALNDYDSLDRCLTSLSEAEYAGDQVDIHIYIDHFEVSGSEKRRHLLAEEGMEAKVRFSSEGLEEAKEGTETITSTSKSDRIKRKKKPNKQSRTSGRAGAKRTLAADTQDDSRSARLPDRVATGVDSVQPSDWRMVEERLMEARRVLSLAESFLWKHGKKVIHYRTTTAGSQNQWLDAWWPSSDDEFALFVEDDAELSPLYYRYARSLIATYYYQSNQFDRLLYGISLQRPQIVPGKNGRPLEVDDRTRLFKYQMVGIWGQIFFPKPWKEFRQWYDSRKSHDAKPVVDGMVTTDWYKQHGEKVFTPWFVKFVYSRGYFNLYTNFLRDRVLSVTHRNIGGKSPNYEGCDSVLIWENGTYDIDLWHMAGTWHIKKYDYCFKEVRVGRFANYSTDVGWVLNSASQGNKEILMVSIVGVPELLVRNWLCVVRKLGIENYILVGEDPVLLEELARRGHATMRFENKQNLKENIEKEVSAVSDLLELGYSVWFTRADTVWVGNPLAHPNTGGADVVGVENFQLSLFFTRSTQETILLWRSLIEDLSNAPVNVSGFANWERARENFIKTCQEEGKVQMHNLDQVVFIDMDNLPVPPTLDGGDPWDAQVVVLSRLRWSADYDIMTKLRQLDFWNLDDDMVCAKLTC